MLPSIRQLQYFVAAAELGQISRAGAAMNVTQSSITIAVRALEDSLGYPLFHRRSNGVELTVQGQVFFNHALRILSQLQALLDLKPALSHACKGRVRMGVTSTISGYFLPNLMNLLRRALPELELDIVELPRRAVEEHILRGKLDSGLVLISDIVDCERFELCPLLVSQRCLWLGAGHRLLRQDRVCLHDLVDENYILVQADNHEEMICHNWQRHNFQPKITFRTQSLEAVRSLIASGYGVSILSDLVYRSWSLETQRIYRKDLVEDISTLVTGLIWPAKQLLSQTAIKLIDIARHYHHPDTHDVEQA